MKIVGVPTTLTFEVGFLFKIMTKCRAVTKYRWRSQKQMYVKRPVIMLQLVLRNNEPAGRVMELG